MNGKTHVSIQDIGAGMSEIWYNWKRIEERANAHSTLNSLAERTSKNAYR